MSTDDIGFGVWVVWLYLYVFNVAFVCPGCG